MIFAIDKTASITIFHIVRLLFSKEVFMSVRQHRLTIFLDDKELKRVYDAVAKKQIRPSVLLRRALMEYLEKLEHEESLKHEYEEVSDNII